MLLLLLVLLLALTSGQHLRSVRGGRRLSLGNAHNGTNVHIRLEIEEPTRIAISEIGGRQTAFDIGVLSKTSDGNVTFVQNSDALHTFKDNNGLSIMELALDQCTAEMMSADIIDFECPMVFHDGSDFADLRDHVTCSSGNCAELGVYEVSVFNASLPAICVTMSDITGPNGHSSGCDSARSQGDTLSEQYCKGTAVNMNPSSSYYKPALDDDKDFYTTCCEWTDDGCVDKYESVDTSDTSMMFVSQCDTDADYHSFENLCVLDSCHRCALSFTCDDTPGVHGQCVSCPDGQDTRDAMNQFVTEGATQCLPCENGKYQTGSMECQSCVAGSETQNVNGTFVVSGATNCEECSFGKHNNDGVGECTACTDGKMTVTGEWMDFTYVTSGASLCRSCPHGKVSQNNSECSDCPDGTGTFRVMSDGSLSVVTSTAHVCSLCTRGQYSRRYNTVAQTYKSNGTEYEARVLRCMWCGDGKETTNGTGNGYHPYEREFGEVYTDLGATDCSECAPGYWLATEWEDGISGSMHTVTQCVECEPGHEIGLVGSLPTSCTACSAGKFSRDYTCLDCPDGSETVNASNVFVTSEATLCTPCTVGKYQTGNSECQVCEDGYNTIGTKVSFSKLADLDGLLPGDQAGGSVHMVAHPNIRVAVGSPASNLNGTDRGHVRVFDYVGGTFHQRGQTIIGERPGDYSGCSVKLGDLGDTLVIGAHGNAGEHGNETRIGHVRVFDYVNSQWLQRGLDIDGEFALDGSGLAIDVSDSGMLVVGSPGANGEKGHVRVFEWISGTWTQKGQTIVGLNPGEMSGYSVSLDESPNLVLAIGVLGSNANGPNSGAARIYTFSNELWNLVHEIKGEYPGDTSGYSVKLNGEGRILAIGAIYNDGNGQNSGHVRVYERWAGDAYPNFVNWLQKGEDINGESSGDLSGFSISISESWEFPRIYIGAIMNNGTDANGIRVNSGHVRSWKWDGLANMWIMEGEINGEASGDFSGAAVASRSWGNYVVIGSVGHDGNGQVRLFERNYESNVYVTSQATECTACAIGQYQSGTDECQQCPDGSQTLNGTNSVVTSAASQCVPCEAGKFQTGNDACQQCADGSDTRNSEGQFVSISATQCVPCAQGKETLTEVAECTFIDCAVNTYKCADSSTGTCGAIGAVNCQGQCVNSIQYQSSFHLCPVMYASFELHHNPDAALPLSEPNKCGSAVTNTTDTCVHWRGHLTNNFSPTSVETLADQDSTLCHQLQTIHEQNEVKQATPNCVPYFSVIAPIYVYPHVWNGTHNNMAPEWVLFIETAKTYPRVQFHVIINPSNGADSLVAPNLSWSDLIQQLKQLTNVKLYGYVPTGYGSTNVSSTVAQYIQGYASNWQMQDIFLDEMNGVDDQGQDTFQTYNNYKDDIGGDTLCNFGSRSDSAGNAYDIGIMLLCTQSILLENAVSQLEPYVVTPAQTSQVSLPVGSLSLILVSPDEPLPTADDSVLRDRFSTILHTSGNQPSFDSILDKAFARTFGSIYITPGTGANPYQQMLQSADWRQFIKKIDDWSITEYMGRNY